MSSNSDLPPTLLLLYHFRHLSNAIEARVAAAHPQLSPNDIGLLLLLGTPKRMKDLAETMTCQPSNMTTMVKKAEAKGWVRRKRSEQDARTVFVELTEHGSKLREQLMSEIHKLTLETSGISEDDFGTMLNIFTRTGN